MHDTYHSTVIICAAGSGVSYGMIHRLRATWGKDINLIAIDINPPHLVTASILCEHYLQVSHSSCMEFQDQLASLIYKHPSSHIYPAINADYTALALVQRLHNFRNCDFVSIESQYLPLIADKLALYQFLTSIGVLTPITYSSSDVLNGEVPHILFAKPRNGYGSMGAGKITRDEVLVKSNQFFADNLIQEICQGPEITVDVYFDVKKGDVAVVCRERIEVKAGVCTKARIFLHKELESIAIQIGYALKYRGSFCFQVLTKDGRYVVTDLNFRPGAGTAISCSAGADFFSAMHACRCEENGMQYIDTSIIKAGDVYVTRQYFEYITKVVS